MGLWCVQKQNRVLRVPAGFRGHSSEPPALVPLAFCISHACLALFLLIEVSAPFSSACCQAAPTPSYRCGSRLSGRHIGSLEQHSPPGNSNRWGGTASLTDGPTEAGLLQQSSLGNQRQERSHRGCLLNRSGRGRRDEEEAKACSQPQAEPAPWGWAWRGRATPMLFYRPRSS